MRLAGQVAVVTGAGRGIGRAIALALASEGAKVALLARTAAEIEAVAAKIDTEGGVAKSFQVDIVDLQSVTKTFAAIKAGLGPASLLINNAGSFSAIGPIWDVAPEDWWRDVETNVRGTFNCSRAAIRLSRQCWRRNADGSSTWSAGGQQRPFPTAQVTRPARLASSA